MNAVFADRSVFVLLAICVVSILYKLIFAKVANIARAAIIFLKRLL